MSELFSIGIFPLVLTLLAFRAGQLLQMKLRSPLCNPILVAVILVLCFRALTGMELSVYQSGTSLISWLLTPATVCLAISMYEQYQVLRRNTPAILAGVAAGAVSCLVMVLVCSLAAGFDRELTVSLLPKSVTTAIGVPLAQMSGGVASVSTAAIVFTGILASVLGPSLCKLFRLTDRIAQGAAFGTAGHVIGTSKAAELDPLAGAVSSLSLAVAGLLTAIVLPLLLNFLS